MSLGGERRDQPTFGDPHRVGIPPDRPEKLGDLVYQALEILLRVHHDETVLAVAALA